MDWQQVTSLLIVAVTALLLTRHEIRRRKRARVGACGQGCECQPGAMRDVKRETRFPFRDPRRTGNTGRIARLPKDRGSPD